MDCAAKARQPPSRMTVCGRTGLSIMAAVRRAADRSVVEHTSERRYSYASKRLAVQQAILMEVKLMHPADAAIAAAYPVQSGIIRQRRTLASYLECLTSWQATIENKRGTGYIFGIGDSMRRMER